MYLWCHVKSNGLINVGKFKSPYSAHLPRELISFSNWLNTKILKSNCWDCSFSRPLNVWKHLSRPFTIEQTQPAVHKVWLRGITGHSSLISLFLFFLNLKSLKHEKFDTYNIVWSCCLGWISPWWIQFVVNAIFGNLKIFLSDVTSVRYDVSIHIVWTHHCCHGHAFTARIYVCFIITFVSIHLTYNVRTDLPLSNLFTIALWV